MVRDLERLTLGWPEWLVIIVWAVLVVVAVMWFFLPLAVYGIKPYLSSIRRDVRRLTRQVEQLEKALHEKGATSDVDTAN